MAGAALLPSTTLFSLHLPLSGIMASEYLKFFHYFKDSTLMSVVHSHTTVTLVRMVLMMSDTIASTTTCTTTDDSDDAYAFVTA